MPPGCNPVPPSPDIKHDSGTITSIALAVSDFVTKSPVREGQLATIDVTGSGTAFFMASLTSTTQLFVPLGGALHVGPPILIGALGPIPATGTLSVSAAVPQLPVSVLGLTAVFQAATCDANGICALTAPALFATIDSTL